MAATAVLAPVTNDGSARRRWARSGPPRRGQPLRRGRDPGGGLQTAGRFDDAPFIRACRGLTVDRVPVWFMRQAGRSLPEYRAARGAGSILDAIARPELVAELTRQPVDRYGTDAAILFSDIVVPVAAIGFGVDVAPGTGPVVAEPFRSKDDLQRLRPLEPETDTPYVIDAVRILADGLGVPLIGFAGGPFTVASYLVEGGPSKNFTRIKALMLGEPAVWHDLVERLTDLALASLRSQLDAGAVGGAGLRQLGRNPHPAPLRGAGPALHHQALRRTGRVPPRCPHHPVRRGHRRAAVLDGHRREHGGRDRLAGAAWTRPDGGSGPESPSRGTSTRPCA